ncbi:MAG: T9SS type A sorting domain-containing protein [Ignavibacteriae bacterium]|nr:T9SS type A sorting domain-containing protein [Ignavibacteriota bacterium]
MKGITKTVFALALLLLMIHNNANAQLTGTKTIPGTYASIKLAIDDLNANGVGTGGVTFNIAAGHTETIPLGGLVIDITTNQPAAGNPVVFQKNGAGANPILQTDVSGSGVLGASGADWNGDAILKLVGTDHITINNIDFIENYTGTSQTLRTESGIRLLRKSSTDGCKNVLITGCTIQQQQTDYYSTCIASLNRNLAGGGTNPTTIDGRHENVSIQGCTMNNSRYGIYCRGYNAPSPYDLYDHFFDIGGTVGNTLTNIGSGLAGGTVTIGHQGIFISYHDSTTISNNIIRINTGISNSYAFGIWLANGFNNSVTIHNNDISDTLGGTSQSNIPIFCDFGDNGVDNAVNITNNKIHDCVYNKATTATNSYIYVQTNPYTLNITGNIIRDNNVGNGTSSATGSIYNIYKSTSNNLFGASITIANNTVKNISKNQSTPGSGNMYGVYVTGPNYNTEIHDNVIDSLFNPGDEGNVAGIYTVNETDGKLSIHGNTISSLFKESVDKSNLFGIAYFGDTDTVEIYDNNIFNLHNTTGSCLTVGINTRGNLTGGYVNVYDNIVHSIVSTGIYRALGILIEAENTSNLTINNVTGNTIYDIRNDSTGQTGGLYIDGPGVANISANRIYNIVDAAGSTPAFGLYFEGLSYSNCNVYNNMISEIYAPAHDFIAGVVGLGVAGGDTVNLSYNTIYMDSSSTGTNSGSFGLYLFGPGDMTMKNNIVVNKFTPSGTGKTVAIFGDAGATYGAASNNNNLFVPAGASNFFYFDGGNYYSTFAAFQTAVAPADTNSFTEDSPFMNVSSHPYNLDMKTNVATLCEGGAIPIAGITTDIHGTTRNPSIPDVGADEFNGIGPITQAPVLVYPANNAVLVEVNPLMNWDDVGSAVNYHIQISTDSTFGSTLVDVDTITSSQLQLGNNFLAVNTKYYWRVSGKNTLGEGPFSSVWSFTTGVTNIEPTSLPTVYELYQNYPNPFNPSTKIKFDIPKAGFVSLKVYDITGREVATLVNRNLEPQRYEVEWSGAQFASGVYFFRITAGDFVKVQKMMLIK